MAQGQKRAAVPNIYLSPKKHKHESTTNTLTSLTSITQIFKKEVFDNRLPAIIMKHQLYALAAQRTEVDKHINELCSVGRIRQFKLGPEEDEIAIVFLDDYIKHASAINYKNKIVERFLNSVVANCPDLSYDKASLEEKYSFMDADVNNLIQCGILTTRDVGSWWLAIPHAGEFVKTFRKGRKTLIAMLRRSKYKEILQQELESRKLPKNVKLGMNYHIYDIIGSDIVKLIKTSSGKILRLKESEW